MELLKLHLKHYHMTLKSFKYRTSELRLPQEIYDMYEEVVQKCEHCNLKHAKPSRSRLSGLRAATFGDLLFLDHAEVKLRGATYHVLLIVDAASSCLAAYA